MRPELFYPFPVHPSLENTSAEQIDFLTGFELYTQVVKDGAIRSVPLAANAEPFDVGERNFDPAVPSNPPPYFQHIPLRKSPEKITGSC